MTKNTDHTEDRGLDWRPIQDESPLARLYRSICVHSFITFKGGATESCQVPNCHKRVDVESIEDPIALRDHQGNEYKINDILLAKDMLNAVEAFRKRILMCGVCFNEGML